MKKKGRRVLRMDYTIERIELDPNEILPVTVIGKGSRDIGILPGISMVPVFRSAAALSAFYGPYTEDFRFLVFDRKENFPEDYTVEEMAEDTVRAMQKMHVQKADFFGASQGGMIAQSIALDHPEAVRSIVLGSTAARTGDMAKAVFDEWIRLAAVPDPYLLGRSFFKVIYSEGYVKRMDRAIDLLARTYTKEQCGPFLTLCRACILYDRLQELDRIQCPSLVIGGGKDRVFGSEASSEMADRIGCECFLYEDGEHAVYDEAKDYVDRILRFVSENS